jgi:putative aminopeptidase FrvX
MSPYGIGGDDRAGVYMIMQILKAARCHVLFCEDEETGGNGAREFTKSSIHPEIHYIVELDRRDTNDAVSMVRQS